MKKILFLLVALLCSMSMTAQVIIVKKNGQVVHTYTAEEADEVVIEEVLAPTSPTKGTAKRNGNYDVNWVQLWVNGPKFAEYNVGAANNRAEDYGGYYCWGMSTDKDPGQINNYNKGTAVLSGDDDTATYLWGSNWRMPTKAEFDDLLANCDVAWTVGYKGTGINGITVTGKGVYSDNSVFFPAAGFYNGGDVIGLGTGQYWSSTPNSNDNDNDYAYYLDFYYYGTHVYGSTYRVNGFSVRAVLAE